MLTYQQMSDLIEFIIEDFGSNLDHEEFADCCLRMFEDISGFECLDENQVQSIITRLWRLYAQN